MFRVLDLFSGIGGFSLGLEQTGGFKTVAFCEIEDYPRRVLARHWPEVPIYDDVRTLTAQQLRTDGIGVDVICGGFPCQDISLAGAGAGIDGSRSGLWRDYARLVGELRPHYVIVENTAALLVRGIDRVLGDLAALGYDAEWHCIQAADVGAPHLRDRVWIVAYPQGERGRAGFRQAGAGGEVLARQPQHQPRYGCRYVADADSIRAQIPFAGGITAVTGSGGDSRWTAEPNVGRVAYGVPNRVDRLGGLGNAVVPKIPKAIGHAILAAEAAQ